MITLEKTTYLVDSISAVALERFKRFGYGKTSVDEIASKLRISKKTIYEIFSSKEEILSEALWRDMKAATRTFIQHVPENLPPDRLMIAFCRFIYDDRERNGDTGLFWGFYHEDPSIRNSAWNALKRVIGGIHRDGVKTGVFAPVQTAFAAEVVGSVILAAVNRVNSYEAPERIYNESLVMIAGALMRRGGSQPQV
jgi:AcrR family transcriptional regulator